MSGRWFDSSRQIFWDNNQQDLTVSGSFKGTSGTFDTLYGPELYTATQIVGTSIGANLTAVSSITPGDNWISVAMSASGQYQSAIDQNNQVIWISNDYGITWAVSSGSPPPVDFYKIAISASGQYQSVVADADYIYVSSDYGRTWTQVNQSVGVADYRSIGVSASGQYQTAAAYNKPLFISSNYGITWTPADSQRGWYDVAVSASGQYQTATDLVSFGAIYTSSNYGVTWTSVAVNVGLTNRYVAMSANGQYQITIADSTNSIYLSSNYGMNWATTGGILSTWSRITMSASGQYIVAYETTNQYIWISTDYGVTLNTNSVVFALDCMAVSASADYFTTGIIGNTLYTSTTPVILPNVQIGTANISSIVIPIIGLSSINTNFISSGVIISGDFSTLTANISSAIITNLQGDSIFVSTLTGNALSISSLVGNTLFASTATVSTLTGNAVSISSLVGNTLFASTATFSTLTGNAVSISSLVGNTLFASTATVSTLTGNAVSISSLVGNTLFASTATVSTLTGNAVSMSSITGNTLFASTATFSTLTGNALSMSSLRGNTLFASTATVSTLTGNAVSISSLVGNTLFASTATVSTLTGNAVSISSLVGNTLFASTATVSTLTGNAVLISSLVGNTLFASTATVSTLTGNALSMSSLRGNTLFASTATFSTLTGNAVSISSLVGNTLFASTATFSTLTGNAVSISSLVGNTLFASTATVSTLSGNLGLFSNLTTSNAFYSWQTTTTGDSFNTGTVSNFNVGSGNFTMECFFYPTANPTSYGTIMSLATTATGGHEFRISQRNGIGGLGFLYPSTATADGAIGLSATSTLSLNTWCHLALTRSTNWAFLYSNGTAVLSTNLVNHTYNENKQLILFDNPYVVDENGRGYINSARVVLGQILYSGNFIPPTQQLSTNSVGAYGFNVLPSLPGAVAFLGGTVSTLTDAGPSALALTISGSPRSGTTVPTTFTGRIGINCNTPQFGLDVNGAANINGNLLIGNAYVPILANNYRAVGIGGGNSMAYMYGAFQSLSDGIHLSYNYISSNLGAGTYANPDLRGYIPNVGGGTSQLDLQYAQIQFKTGPTNTAPSTVMTLTTGGLGINCNTPSYMLDVNGTVNIGGPGLLAIGNTSTLSGQGSIIKLRSDQPFANALYQIEYNNGVSTGTNLNDIRFVGSTDSGVQRYFAFGCYTGDNRSNAWSTSMAIGSQNGRVGINCNVPRYTLDVNGSATITPPFNNILINSGTQQILLANSSPLTAPYLFMQSVSAAPARIRIGAYSNATAMPISFNEDGGAVGINTSNPNASFALDVNGSANVRSTLTANAVNINTGGFAYSALNFSNTADSNAMWMTFQKPSSTARIGWGGFNLGGTPNYNSLFIIEAPTAGSVIYLNAAAGVGIKTILPAYELDVTGQVRATAGFIYPSDQRAKQNIVSADTSICYSTMQGIDLKYFQWESTIQSTCKLLENHQLGFIAQEIKLVFPHSITLTSSYGYNDFHSMETTQIQAVHYGATKKLMELVEQQGSTIQGIQKELSTLRG